MLRGKQITSQNSNFQPIAYQGVVEASRVCEDWRENSPKKPEEPEFQNYEFVLEFGLSSVSSQSLILYFFRVSLPSLIVALSATFGHLNQIIMQFVKKKKKKKKQFCD